MKRALLFLAVLMFVFINISGCMPLVVGGAVGVVGAYAISKDTMQGDTDKSFDSLWDSALNIARARGNIKLDDKRIGQLDYVENGNKVSIRLVRLTQATIRMRVSARKLHLPNLELAQEVYTRIIDDANTLTLSHLCLSEGKGAPLLGR